MSWLNVTNILFEKNDPTGNNYLHAAYNQYNLFFPSTLFQCANG